jgi:RNA polymerase sigma factor (sigma-70 family)
MTLVNELTKEQRFTKLMRRWAGVEKCMETLGEQERQALRLRYLEGADNAKIAKELGVSKMKVREFAHVARNIISDMLYGHNED